MHSDDRLLDNLLLLVKADSVQHLAEGSELGWHRLIDQLKVLVEALRQQLLRLIEVCVADVHNVRLVLHVEADFVCVLGEELSFDLYCFLLLHLALYFRLFRFYTIFHGNRSKAFELLVDC